MRLKVKVWRQKSPTDEGQFETHELQGVSPFIYILDLLDLVNGKIKKEGGQPVAFDHACRRANCGQCSLTINGVPHGPEGMTTACLTRVSRFEDGETVVIEPFRAKPFPIKKDLMVQRDALDAIVDAGGYMPVKSSGGFISKRDGTYVPLPEDKVAGRDEEGGASAAACINCGACIAACKNGSAMLFVGAKAHHLNSMEEIGSERAHRVLNMVEAMDKAGFGGCTDYGECWSVCPTGVSGRYIAELNRQYLKASALRATGRLPAKLDDEADEEA